MIQRDNDNVLVVGNAPNLATLKYENVPSDTDVFRVNQFFLEDKYFVGNRAKLVFMTSNGLVEEKFYTLKTLTLKKEYEIDNVVFGGSVNSASDVIKDVVLGGGIEFGYDILREANKTMGLKFDEMAYYYWMSRKNPTSGMLLIALAISMGYKNIFVGGIDFYNTKEPYIFDSNKKNIKSFYPNIAKPNQKEICALHSQEVDMQCLAYFKEFLQKSDKNIFSVCDGNINEILPRSQKYENNFLSNKTLKILEQKINYTDDIILLKTNNTFNNKVTEYMTYFLGDNESYDKYKKNIFCFIIGEFIFFIRVNMKLFYVIASRACRKILRKCKILK